MATLQELLAQAQNTQQQNVWGTTNEVGQWSPAYDQTSAPVDEVGTTLPGWSQQLTGPTSAQAVEQLLYAPGRGADWNKQALSQIAQQAGLPTNFDWTPYLTKAAEQHYNQFGEGYSASYTNYAQPVADAVKFAAADNPSLTPFVSAVAPGSAFWNQGNQLRDQQLHRSTSDDEYVKLASVLAGPVLGMAGALPAGGASATAGFGEAAYAGGGAAAGGAAGGAATVGSLGGAGSPTVTGTATGSGQFVDAAGAALPAAGTVPALAGGTTAGGTFTPATQGATTGGAGLGTAAAGTALSRILNGSGTSEDYLSIAGGVLPAALSAYGSYQQSKDMGDLAKRYEGYGAPYRQTLADISQDPSKFYDSPTATKATDAILRRLSIAGNPAGNPYSQALGIDALYKEYGAERDRLAGYGGLTQYNAAAPSAAAGAIGAKGAIYSDVGYGLGNVLAPKPTLAQQLAQYRAAGGTI